ncbi:hypothetical protein OOK31_24400 [Streptomyces sp. NBC_00249]|uniref:hypothetical protein n=1 Tax=Streptomyces sp. NBC_00249 TaxID=2975690 RepID=UPI00225075B1|nr:hypothetical protein [Streptomyces sp. NBC_00249]MCX5196998.1 hypothetical protein [Streptomyces sp. NBC_00249]
MGSPIEIFRLFSYGPCGHDLLVRVVRPGAPNFAQGAVDAADSAADAAVERLRTRWEESRLRTECPHHRHTPVLVGELQELPVGEELFDAGGRRLGVWVARTAYGAPWVALGTASSEAEFWREVRDDPELLGLGPLEPAELRHVDFLTDQDPWPAETG